MRLLQRDAMNLVALAQSLLILRNLNLKPRKYKLEDLTLAAYFLGVQITKLGIPQSNYTTKNWE